MSYIRILLLVLCCSMILHANTKQETQPLETISMNLTQSLREIVEINWQLHLLSNQLENFQAREKLINKKTQLLDSMPQKILSTKQIDFDFKKNMQNRMQKEMIVNDAKLQNDVYTLLHNQIELNDLTLDNIIFQLMQNLKKQIDFFAQKQRVLEILDPSLKEINSLATTFEIPNTLSKEQKNMLESLRARYLNKLAAYTEFITYLQWNATKFVAQNMIVQHGMHWILQKITDVIPIARSHILITKLLLSLLSFLILWACRKLIAHLIIYIMDLLVHLTKQDKQLHANIQKDILKPISLFLLIWSINVSIGILYYPNLEPDSIDTWVSVFYIINIAWFIIAMIKGYGTPLLTNVAQKSNEMFRKEIINLILKVLYSIVFIIALLLILKYLGFNISTIIASLGLGGLAVALAVKDMLANFFASVMLLFDNSFSQGDFIECGSVEGSVVEIGLRRTTIRTSDNSLLFVPNAELVNKVIQNWSRRKVGRRLKMNVGIAYNASQEQLKQCADAIREMLINHPQIATSEKIEKDPEHNLALRKDIISIDDYLGYKSAMYVSVFTLADSSIDIAIDCFTHSISKKDFLETREDIIFKIMDIVAAHKLSFAFPSQSVYVETLPSKL